MENQNQIIKTLLEIGENWDPPTPLNDYERPAFQVECLSDWLKSYVLAVSEDTQTPPDMAAVTALGILSIACSKVYSIEGKTGWREPLNLFLATIARPGERKSAVQSHLSRPVSDYEHQENERLKPEIARNQTEKKILEGELARLQAIASKDNSMLNRELAQDKAAEISEFKELRPLRLVADDVSPEKLAGLLSDNGGRMAVLSAEGGIFDILAGRYSQNVNLDCFLKGHCGDPLRVDRIGRPSEFIEAPALSVVLMIQPQVLSELMANETFRGRGLLARFLFSEPISFVGSRNIESLPIPEEVRDTYNRNVMAMLKVKIPQEPHILQLSPEAYQESIKFAKELEPRLIDDLEPLADWAGKLHGAILRIAGILHVAELVGQSPQEFRISEKTMTNAIKIGYYFLDHAKAVFLSLGADKTVAYVLKFIIKQKEFQLKKRDILRGCRKFQKVEELEPVLQILCDRNFLREVEQFREGPGRNPDKIYQVNPHILSSG